MDSTARALAIWDTIHIQSRTMQLHALHVLYVEYGHATASARESFRRGGTLIAGGAPRRDATRGQRARRRRARTNRRAPDGPCVTTHGRAVV